MQKKYTEAQKDTIVFEIVKGNLYMHEAMKKYKVSRVSIVKWLKLRKPEIDAYFNK